MTAKNVSIIMPSLNVKEYIKESIESVLNQTLCDIEILCIDAGSTDGTLEIIHELAAKDNRIRYIHSDVRSYGYQVNLGIKEASGEYIGIVETDDFVKSDMYEKLYRKAKEFDLDYVKGEFTNIFYISENEQYTMDKHIFLGKDADMYDKVINVNDKADIILKDNNVWRGIYKKTFILNNNIWLNESAGAAYQDIGFVVQTIMLAKKAMYVEEPFYQYRVNRPGCSTFNANVLKFVKQEWERLFNDIFTRNNFPVTETLIMRMQNIVVCETDKLLEMLDYDCTDEHIHEYLPWLLSKLSECRDKYGFTIIEPIIEMINSMGQYAAKLKAQKEAFLKNEQEIIEKAGKYGAVNIFGAGRYGYRVYELLKRNNIQIAGVYDNLKAGEKFAGIVIDNPNNLRNKKTESLFIIANKKHYLEIRQQLFGLDVDAENIIGFHNE